MTSPVDSANPPPRLRVLLVDDNPINLLVAREMLLSLGVDVETAVDGEEALARLAAEPLPLTFMDVQMPVLDGLEATRRLRVREQSAGGGRTIVVALTANAMAGDREICLAAGMDDYLAKPIHREQMADVLRRWLPAELLPAAARRAPR